MLSLRALASLCVPLLALCLAGDADAAAPQVAVATQAVAVTPQIQAHVMKPAHVTGITSFNGTKVTPTNLPGRTTKLSLAPHLNAKKLGTLLYNNFHENAAGYAFQLRQNGAVIENGLWNWSRTPADGNQAWSFDTRMHVASVSKFITGVALRKLLDAKGLSEDAAIINYLPTYWVKGPNIDKITFRELMQHKSGFKTGGSDSDFELMKAKVAQGVDIRSGIGHYQYENMNYGLCRILMSVLNNDIARTQRYIPTNEDQAWDFTTVHAYERYVEANVFAPSGVNGPSFLSSPHNALAYVAPPVASKFPPTTTGWDSGDLTTMAGGAGWHMSVNELMNVMGTFRRKGTIMTPAKAQASMDDLFGIDWSDDTPLGKMYTKNGAWGHVGNTEQNVIFFLPENVELVVFVNSTTLVSVSGVVQWLYGLALD